MADDDRISNTDSSLTAFVERISRLNEEGRGIADDKKDVFLEAKAQGYDRKVLAMAVKRYEENAEQKKAREETEMVLDTYLGALGLL